MKTIHQGILLKKIDYSETSLILQFYTQEKGIQSYLFQGGKKKKGNSLQPLSIVEIEVYMRTDSDLGKISAVSLLEVHDSITFNPLKSGIAFFLAETLTQTLKSTEAENSLYLFLKQEISWLNNHNSLANYPVWFLLKLSSYLGFSPHVKDRNCTYFDLEEGTLSARVPTGHVYLKDETIPFVEKMLITSKEEGLSLTLSKASRKQLTENLLSYFKHHVEGFKTPKSLEVLQTIFS